MSEPGSFLTVEYLLAALRDELDDALLPGTGATPDQDSLWSTNYLLRCLNRAQIEVARDTWDITDVYDIPLTATDEYAYPDYILEIRDKPRIVETDQRFEVFGLGDHLYDRRLNDYDGLPQVRLGTTVTFDEKSYRLRLGKVPTGDDIGRTLRLFVYRLPKLAIRDDLTPLELKSNRYEAALLAWAKREAYNKHDAETYDPRLRDREELQYQSAVAKLYSEARKRRRHGGTVAYGGY